MRQRGFDRSRETPELREVNHDEQNEPRLGHSRSALTCEIVNRSRFVLLALHFYHSN